MDSVQELSDVVITAQRGGGPAGLEAFGELVRRFQDMAVGYAFALLGDEDLAQDAAQEAFVQLYLHLKNIQDPAAFAGWFKKVVFTCCQRMLRRKRVTMVDISAAENLPGDSPEPAQAFDRKVMRAEILAAIQALPEAQREVLVLYYINEFSYKQIASFLGLSETTVTNRLFAAKRKIKKELWHMVEDNVRGMQVSGDDRFVKKILEEVPRVGFFHGGSDCPEDIPVPSILRTVLQVMGEDYGYKSLGAHDTQWRLSSGMVFFSGVSGAVFRFFWRFLERKSGGIDPAYMVLYGDRQFARSLEAAGYRYELLLSPEYAAEIGYPGPQLQGEADTRRRIIASIRDQNRPVIGFGVVGATSKEPCIVNGYDENGEVLIGWSYYQNEKERNFEIDFETAGFYRKRGWYADTFGILTIGEKVPQSPLSEVYRKALAWGVEQMRVGEVDGYTAGWVSYQEWADAMRDSANFPADPEVLKQRVSWIDPAIWELAERRWYAGLFLEQIIERLPDAPKEDLLAARDHFQAEHDLMWEVARLSGIQDGDPLQNLGDPEKRNQIAEVILKARQHDIDAAERIEKALAVTNW